MPTGRGGRLASQLGKRLRWFIRVLPPPGSWGGGGTPQREAQAWEALDTPVFSPLPYIPLGSAEVERMLRRSQAEAGAGDEPVTPDIIPLPYTPLSSAEVQRMLKRARKHPRTAAEVFQ